LREEALDHTVWRTRYGRNCGNIVRQTRNDNDDDDDDDDDEDDDDDVSRQKLKHRKSSYRLFAFKTLKL